jgi:kynurenine formamidase
MKKWHRITAEDFENATPKIEPGDFVVCNTGWHKWWKEKKEHVFFNHYPGLVESGAQLLVNEKIKAIASDWAATDHPVAHPPLQKTMPWLYDEYMNETGEDPDKAFPVYEPCHTMLLKAGINTVEAAGGEIDMVTGKRCTLAAFPFKLQEGDGGMVRLVAIVEE